MFKFTDRALFVLTLALVAAALGMPSHAQDETAEEPKEEAVVTAETEAEKGDCPPCVCACETAEAKAHEAEVKAAIEKAKQAIEAAEKGE